MEAFCWFDEKMMFRLIDWSLNLFPQTKFRNFVKRLEHLFIFFWTLLQWALFLLENFTHSLIQLEYNSFILKLHLFFMVFHDLGSTKINVFVYFCSYRFSKYDFQKNNIIVVLACVWSILNKQIRQQANSSADSTATQMLVKLRARSECQRKVTVSMGVRICKNSIKWYIYRLILAKIVTFWEKKNTKRLNNNVIKLSIELLSKIT